MGTRQSGAPRQGSHFPSSLELESVVLTLRCGIRATDFSQDGSEEEMAQSQQPGTHGGRWSPPHSCPFLLASMARTRDQWAGMCPWQIPQVHPGEPGATSLGLGSQVELQSPQSCLQTLALIFASYNGDGAKGQDQKQENKIFPYVK